MILYNTYRVSRFLSVLTSLTLDLGANLTSPSICSLSIGLICFGGAVGTAGSRYVRGCTKVGVARKAGLGPPCGGSGPDIVTWAARGRSGKVWRGGGRGGGWC
jgi:hypothetical protein